MGAPDRDSQVSDEEILAVFIEYDEPELTADRIAAELPIERDVLTDRLDDLYERSLLDSEDTLGGTEWSLGFEVEDEDFLSEPAVETTVESQAAGTSDLETSPRRTDARAPSMELPEDESVGDTEQSTSDLIDAMDLPGKPDQQEQRREALKAAYRHLRDGMNASREEFMDDVFPDNPAGFDRPDDGWWEQVIRPGLITLPDIERRGEQWRFVGDEHTDRVR